MSVTLLRSEALATARRELERRKRLVAMKEEAENDLLSFVRLMWPTIEPEKPLIEGWILEMLCDVLMAITDGHLTRVSINVPPGSMKSSLLNVLWPAFEWGPCNMPHLRYLSLSYSTAIPVRDNLRFAQIIRSPLYQQCWGDRVKLLRDGAEWVGNDRTGWKAVTSVGGSTTGMRGDRLLCDDVSNPMDVESDLVRSTTARFVREIMPTRLNDMTESAIINLQQRTHQEDATGVLLDYGQGYTFIVVPAEFDPTRIFPVVLRRDDDGNPTETWVDPRSLDENGEQLVGLVTNARGEADVIPYSPMAMAAGTSFWPERFPEDELLRLKNTMTAYAWDSQFQQIPGVRGGAILQREWWQNWASDTLPTVGTVVVSVDTAVEEKESADYNAVTVWGAFEGNEGQPQFILMDAWRDRLALAQLVYRIAQTCRQHHANYLLLEHKTRGRDVHNEIRRLYGQATWETVLVVPQGDKTSRLKAVMHLFSGDVTRQPDGGTDPRTGKPTTVEVWSGGMVWAPVHRGWCDEVITEAASFPYGKHDDYVDSVTMACSWMRKHGVMVRKIEWDDEERERNMYRKPVSTPYMIRRA